jgi:hypothetical protein
MTNEDIVWVNCPLCEGTGICPKCNGKYQRKFINEKGKAIRVICPECGDNGWNGKCWQCCGDKCIGISKEKFERGCWTLYKENKE